MGNYSCYLVYDTLTSLQTPEQTQQSLHPQCTHKSTSIQLVTTTGQVVGCLVQVVTATPSLAIGPPSSTIIPAFLLRFTGYKHTHMPAHIQACLQACTYAWLHTWPHDVHDAQHHVHMSWPSFTHP